MATARLVFAKKLGAGRVRCLYDAATDVATLFATLTCTDVGGRAEKKPLEGNERLQISNLFYPSRYGRGRKAESV
jgi:hypothetical protein